MKRLIVLILLLFTSVGYAAVPDKPAGRVSDYAGVFSPAIVVNVTKTLADYEKRTGIQIVAVSFQSINGESIESFSIKLAEKWKIGHKGKDDGIIIIFAMQERKVRLEVGYGLEHILPDALCLRILQRSVIPNFKKGDYDSGLKDVAEDVIKSIGK